MAHVPHFLVPSAFPFLYPPCHSHERWRHDAAYWKCNGQVEVCAKPIAHAALEKFHLEAAELTEEQLEQLRRYYSTDFVCIAKSESAVKRSRESCQA